MKEKILFSWSGGKDSALALHTLQQDGGFEIAALFTTVTAPYDRISMHGVRVALLEKQAASLGLALEKITIGSNCGFNEWEEKIAAVLLRHKVAGITAVAFGDIFLEDLKKYREENLAKIGLKGVFPIWKQESGALAKRFIDLQFKAVITCVDGKKLDGKFSGRDYDAALLKDLPADVDCCGENGEFHSFVYAGPNFNKAVSFSNGPVVLRDKQFYFCDLIPD
jgi:uncharacterized protein (TIGR00290 family)